MAAHGAMTTGGRGHRGRRVQQEHAMDLPDMQQQVDTWIRAHGGYWDRFQILARLTEELGEVASALQRQQGLRPREADADLAGEVGDLLFTLAAFANVNGLSLEDCLKQVFEKYDIRDGDAWKARN
jgi:NTP pyrophosphatase (non-canonical NTP hydrolase)